MSRTQFARMASCLLLVLLLVLCLPLGVIRAQSLSSSPLPGNSTQTTSSSSTYSPGVNLLAGAIAAFVFMLLGLAAGLLLLVRFTRPKGPL